MSTAFLITGIKWDAAEPALPASTVLDLPSWLTSLGHEDFEPEGLTDDFDDDDWDDYEPSDAAWAAFEAEWDNVIRELLQKKFGAPVLGVARYEPK